MTAHPDLPRRRVQVTPPSTHLAAWSRFLADADLRTPAEALSVSAGDTVLLTVAHPDDETLGFGASLAQLVETGVAVHVLCLTAGEAAFDQVGIDVPGLGARRRAELDAAARALGIEAAALEFPDAHVEEVEEQAVEAVAAAIDRLRPVHLVTTWSLDPHPDHRATGRATLRAALSAGLPVSEFPVWAPHFREPSVPVTRMRTDEHAETARAAALREYRSQTEPIDERVEAVLPPAVLGWPHELVMS